MQKISPFLWFDGNAEEAVNFYASVFPNAKIGKILRSSKAGPGPEGSVLTVSFELGGLQFTALNGGSQFRFTEAVSFTVSCNDQAEVDYYWDCLSEDGEPRQCGWVKDRFGLFWQITRSAFIELMNDPDPDIAARVATTMMSMDKFDIAGIERAAKGI